MSEPLNLPDRPIFIRGFEPAEIGTFREAWLETREIKRHGPLIAPGESRRLLVSISDGWAGRIAEDSDSRRHILDLFLRGDLCGLDAMAGAAHDNVRALTKVTVECFDAEQVGTLLADHPALASAFLRHSILQHGTSRTGHSRMRLRGATGRVAALIQDLLQRLRAEDATIAHDPYLQLTQFDLADATGLTAIHVNRVVSAMRLAGIISLDRRKLRVMNWTALRAAAHA